MAEYVQLKHQVKTPPKKTFFNKAQKEGKEIFGDAGKSTKSLAKSVISAPPALLGSAVITTTNLVNMAIVLFGALAFFFIPLAILPVGGWAIFAIFSFIIGLGYWMIATFLTSMASIFVVGIGGVGSGIVGGLGSLFKWVLNLFGNDVGTKWFIATIQPILDSIIPSASKINVVAPSLYTLDQFKLAGNDITAYKQPLFNFLADKLGLSAWKIDTSFWAGIGDGLISGIKSLPVVVQLLIGVGIVGLVLFVPIQLLRKSISKKDGPAKQGYAERAKAFFSGAKSKASGAFAKAKGGASTAYGKARTMLNTVDTKSVLFIIGGATIGLAALLIFSKAYISAAVIGALGIAGAVAVVYMSKKPSGAKAVIA
ncbi:MAG: hypothetical protein PHH26_00400 [Candidatus Thermoplasmatota archaeon]|nr:hypothetical protein [Candidatus Thermoplasmatota archaeon]